MTAADSPAPTPRLRLRRPDGEAPLTARDLPRLLGSDATLRPAGRAAVVWTSLFTGATMRLALDDGELVVLQLEPRERREECLGKLRQMAGRLGARVIGEDGTDLTVAPPSPPQPRRPLAAVGRALIVAIAFPVGLLLLVLRLPWWLYKAWRVK